MAGTQVTVHTIIFFVIIAKNIQKQVIVQLFQRSHLAGGEDGLGTSLRTVGMYSLAWSPYWRRGRCWY